METSSRELNIKYAFVQAGYWMGFCVAFSFGAVMLQARGCSNAELGGIMAAGNICGFILSPMLAERLDSSKRLTVYHALWALQLFELVLLAAFALIPGHGTAVAVIYTLYIAIEVCINPVNTQLYNLMELRGIHINYGLARGVGSLAFAAISAVLGILAGSLGAASLPVAGLVLCLFRCAALLNACSPSSSACAAAAIPTRFRRTVQRVRTAARSSPFCGITRGSAGCCSASRCCSSGTTR